MNFSLFFHSPDVRVGADEVIDSKVKPFHLKEMAKRRLRRSVNVPTGDDNLNPIRREISEKTAAINEFKDIIEQMDRQINSTRQVEIVPFLLLL